MLLALGFSVAPQWGWTSLPTLGTFLGAVLLLAGFLWNESRVRAPLIPLSIFRIRNVSGANLMMVPLYAAMLGMFFLITLYLQGALHLSPLMTGLSFLPFPVILGFVSTRMPKLVGRYGFRRFLIMGPALVALAYLWLVRLPEHGTYLFDILPALLIMPIGMGMSIMPTIAAGTSGVPSHEAGLASGLISTAQQMGGALGLSVLTGIAASTVGPAVLGYHAAFSVGIGFLLAAVAVAVFVIHTPKKEAEEEHLPGRVDASKLALGH
jgi:predicted MFS family arabinose efflux permease